MINSNSTLKVGKSGESRKWHLHGMKNIFVVFKLRRQWFETIFIHFNVFNMNISLDIEVTEYNF